MTILISRPALSVPLTSIAQPKYQLGFAAAQLIIEECEDREKHIHQRALNSNHNLSFAIQRRSRRNNRKAREHWRATQETISAHNELAPLLKFQTPTIHRKKRRLEKALTIWDLRELAKKRTPRGPFDYTDGTAETEVSLRRARQAFLDMEFQPNILHDVSNADLARTALGETFKMPSALHPPALHE